VLIAFVAIVAPPSQSAVFRKHGNLSLASWQPSGIPSNIQRSPSNEKYCAKRDQDEESKYKGVSFSKKNQDHDIFRAIQGIFHRFKKEKNPRSLDNQLPDSYNINLAANPPRDERKEKSTWWTWLWTSNSSIFNRRQNFQTFNILSSCKWTFQTILDITKRLSHRAIEMSFHIQSKGSPSTLTQVVDKILTSTPRLLAIANLLLALTYLLHSIVVDVFLGHEDIENQHQRSSTPGATFGASTSSRMHRSGRERLGGYLLFKLLLISAVVEPDTLDLLILLSWYTVLSFLRSLAHLAAMTVAHAQASGQPPPKGVLRLLLIILVSDMIAAYVCVALFHGAGVGMVLLLNCDCALLAVDVLAHLTRYLQQVLDENHNLKVAAIEAVQIKLHSQVRSLRTRSTNLSGAERQDHDEVSIFSSISAISAEAVRENDIHDEEISLLEESRRMDQTVELLEASRTMKINFLESVAYFFELVALVLAVLHFLHIWSLHGVTFNLVDGVLVLHIQSAVAAIGKKIAAHQHVVRIARDLDSLFDDASEVDMKKAALSGDVCCICLGTMTTGNVKKVGCGHLYHSICLREVVERARSIEFAKCPLCRSPIIQGCQSLPVVGLSEDIHRHEPIVAPPMFGLERANNEVNIVARLGPDEPPQATTNTGVNSIFRISTEGLFPVWLPLPAFSFEIVRRPAISDTSLDNASQQLTHHDELTRANNVLNDQRNQPVNTTLFRRILLLIGLGHMTPQEEANAIAQLVDMFPQYERTDLLRELRSRGSSDAVVESIFSGMFIGVERRGFVQTLDH
jgi:hypothetical protein